MIYTWFKRLSPSHAPHIMNAHQASVQARAMYATLFADEVESVGRIIAKEVGRGLHKVDILHGMESAMALEVAAYLSRLGYTVDISDDAFAISWRQTPEDVAK